MAKTPAPQYRSESLPEYKTRGVSLRAVVLGLALVVLINLWMPYSEYIVRASRMNLSHFPVAVFILFLLIRYLLNPLLSTLNPTFLLALLFGCLTFIFYVIPLGYERGAFNFNDIPLKSGTNRIYPVILSKIVNPFGPDWQRIGFFGGGAALMGLFTFLQYRFSGWPLHPIGLTVCSTNVARSNQVSIFIVWAFKLFLLHFGGVSAYRRFQPFFIGLLTGYGLGVALSFAVDALWFSGQGHYIHRW